MVYDEIFKRNQAGIGGDGSSKLKNSSRLQQEKRIAEMYIRSS